MTMYARKFGHMRKKYQRNTNKEEMDVETPQKKKMKITGQIEY